VDARGIFVARVCDHCHDLKRSKYRPEIFEDSRYAHDEPIFYGQSPHTFDVDV
jgi:hypothetical protein